MIKARLDKLSADIALGLTQISFAYFIHITSSIVLLASSSFFCSFLRYSAHNPLKTPRFHAAVAALTDRRFFIF